METSNMPTTNQGPDDATFADKIPETTIGAAKLAGKATVKVATTAVKAGVGVAKAGIGAMMRM